jgi:uncharacterized protein DUF4041/Meiotically Up-regulated Gene 113 (MUG113) protein
MVAILGFVLGVVVVALVSATLWYRSKLVDARADYSKIEHERARAASEASQLHARFSRVTDLEAEVTETRSKLEQTKQELQMFEVEAERKRGLLTKDYEEAVAKYKGLKSEVSLLEENLDDMSFGLYKPHFSFQTSEQYKAELEKLWDQEKQLIRDGRAAVCQKQWTVQGSEREGAKMVKLNEKLFLRAFNGECDAAVANVSWNNVMKMEERIRKSFEAINKFGEVLSVAITVKYRDIKLDEVRLAHEYQEKRHQEREEQRRVREEHREEERALREIEEAREQAELEEERYQRALEKARKEAAEATGAQLEKLSDQISSFESKLDEARKNKERAISRAQQTKSGFVYVISNVGSFGDGIFKIGMTRRMEPMDRVDELGGASVPFPFDLHVMFFSDNAPDLENALHRLFEERRVNLMNPRREFYSGVKLDEIEAFAKDRGLTAQFMKVPEAKEFRQSVAKREQAATGAAPKTADNFSVPLFSN